MEIKTSAFRQFCQEKWFEHKDEILAWTKRAVDYDSDYYFKKHRWMLRRLYQDYLVEQYRKKTNNISKKG